MMRVLVWIFVLSSFIYSNDIFKPLFPKGEKLEKKFIINNPDNPINSLISHNGKFIITIENEYFSKIRFWDIETKNIIFQKKDIDSHSKQLALTKDDKYLLYDDSLKLILFDVKKKKIKKKINLKEYTETLEISQNGDYIAFSNSKNINLYDIKRDKIIYKLDINSSVNQVKISKDSSFLFFVTADSLQLINLKNTKKIVTFALKNIKKIDISKNEKFIVAISDNTIYKLNIVDKRIENLETKGSFNDVKVYDDKYIITSGDSYLDGIHIWDITTKQNIFTIDSTRSTKNISLSDDNKYLVTTDEYNNNLFLINLFSLDIVNFNRLRTSKKTLYSEKYNKLFSIDNQKGIKVWNLQKNRLETILDDNMTINDFSLSRDEQLLVTTNTINFRDIIKIWNINNRKNIFSFEDKDMWNIEDVDISKNSNLIACLYGYSDLKIKILDINKSKIINTIVITDNYVSNFSFLDNNYIILSSYNKIKVIDIESGEIVKINEKKNQYFSFYTNKKFYSIDSREVRDILIDKKIFTTKGIISDIVGNLVFINDYPDYKIWDLREKRYIKKFKRGHYKVYSVKNKIALYNLNNNKILTNIYYKKNNHWLIEDVFKKRVYRYMDEKLLLTSHTFKYIYQPKIEIKNKDIDIFLLKDNLDLINNQIETFDIQIENLTDKSIYNIDFRVDDNNFSISSKDIALIKPHEQKKVTLGVKFNNFIHKSFSKNINLEILLNGISQTIPIKTSVIKSDKKEIEIESLNLLRAIRKDDDNLEIKINNLTNYDLKNIEATIFYHNNIIKKDNLYIEANSSKTISFSVDKNISKDGFLNTFLYKIYDDDFNITIHTNLFNSYKFNKDIDLSFEYFGLFYIIFIFVIIVPWMLIWILYKQLFLKKYDKTVNKLINDPASIYDIDFNKLLYYKKIIIRRFESKLFGGIFRIEKIPFFTELFNSDFNRTVRFFEVTNKGKANILADRINGVIKDIDEEFFELTLDKNFVIKVKKILLYFPLDSNIEKIYKTLENKRSEGILVIAKNEKEQQLFADSLRLNGLPNVIVTMPKNIKIFLLQENHSLTMSKILSLKLDRKIISPYKTKNGVQNESYFFGREKILQQITEREPSNYLIVGARQIGKTSILFALERIFRAKNELEVIQMTLSSGSPIRKIALKLNMDRDSTLEDIEEYILRSDKPYLFLIDEVDGFIKNEEQERYSVLDTFRSLTQEGKAYFIMAGFWELYYQATYDYQSPIKNFGEIITVDKLEDDACLKLLLEPMSALNLNFKNQDKSASLIINSLGKRANLIATVANEIVENLDSFRFEIDDNDIGNALNSRKVLANFNSWQKLTDSEFKSYIDRFIVYYTIGLNSFTIRKIINLFKKIGVEKVTIDEIRESLDRLELSYILAREGQSYFYTIPLFQEHLKREDIKAILDEMIDEFRGRYDD